MQNLGFGFGCFLHGCTVLQWFRSYLVGLSQHARHGSTTSTAVCCPSDLQRHCAWITAVMFHSSCRHDVKTTVAVLCLPSSGSTASSSVYCQQAILPSFRRQHNDLPSHVTSSIVLHSHSHFSDSISKHYK